MFPTSNCHLGQGATLHTALVDVLRVERPLQSGDKNEQSPPVDFFLPFVGIVVLRVQQTEKYADAFFSFFFLFSIDQGSPLPRAPGRPLGNGKD